jgi:outer membrane protein TolC
MHISLHLSLLSLSCGLAIALIPGKASAEAVPAPRLAQLTDLNNLNFGVDEPEVEPRPEAPELTPDALDAPANPLLFPTQPEEVEVIGEQPLSLEQVIELAYRNDPDFQVALLELQRSQAALDEARAALLPSVTAGADFTAREGGGGGAGGIDIPGNGLNGDLNGNGNGGGGSSINYVLGGNIELSYNLFTSGQRSAQIAIAERGVRLSELELERRREVLRLSAVNDYYALQEAQEQIRINQAFLTEAERSLRDAEIREQVGVGTRFNVLTAQVQVANAQQTLVQAQNQQRISQRQLAQRLNLPQTLEVTTTAVEIRDDWPLSMEETIVQAFQNRAELEQQLVDREIGEEQRRLALSALGPQVSVFANYSLQDTLNRSNSFRDNYALGARLNMNLFDGGAAAASARQRDRDIEIAETRFTETRNLVRFEVEEAFFTLDTNRTNITTAELAVEQAREALELARLRLSAGVGTQLEVISAQADLTEAEGNRITAIVGYNRAIAALERAVSNLTYLGEATPRF